MKIRKISFENHPVFGTLHFDFTDEKGKTINTIIIAGENGVGKSLLLNTIFEFSQFSISNERRNEKRVFEIELSNDEIDILKNSDNHKHLFSNESHYNILIISFDFNIIGNWNQINITSKTSDETTQQLQSTLFSETHTRIILRTIFSDVEINFTPQQINAVTSANIDRENIASEKSNSNLATEITQLLIDVQSLDALEFSEWARENIGIPVDNKKIDVRLKRFTNAFDFMFPSKKYKRIVNANNSKQIIFEENGREMAIDKLSSGEKQIVFRGGFLLKDKESSKGTLILIDEPEISLHPNWQLKILSFFKKLFTNDSGEQTSQLIISTHSPFIIHNADRNDDKVIVLQKNEMGQTIVLNEPKFYAWSSEKIVQEAFNVSQILDTNKVIVFLEGETDERYFNKCVELFEISKESIEFKWIGRINERGNAENTGDTALNQAKTFFCAHMDFIKNKVVLFYDNDTNKPEEVIENLFIKKMSKNNENIIYKIGIENLLILPAEFDKSMFESQKIKIDDYSAQSLITTLDKTKLCSYICENTSIEKQKEILERIKLEIEALLLGSVDILI